MMTSRSLICLLENQNGGKLQKVSFFYSADLRTRCARAANFPSRKKKYYVTHLYHKQLFPLRCYNEHFVTPKTVSQRSIL
jgi:hypothetical protein